MQSFRTELENPLVEQDILDLAQKIQRFRNGQMDEDRFRALRLARGVYGQRQHGVQMVRIKLPCGRLTTRQLWRICEVADTYANGNLHLTTRQDVQLHYVQLEDTPQLWAELERDEVTLREACGNTVRNITASSFAGIDPREPFDVYPYAHAMFAYFLRKPVCQEMGRKFKIAFSSSAADTGLAFMHDLGFIPVVNAAGERGFRVLAGGGLGAQAILATEVTPFLPTDRLIPFTEGVLRVFDRYGERDNRSKARFKFLVQKLGLPQVLALVEQEANALPHPTYPIDLAPYAQPPVLPAHPQVPVAPADPQAFALWRQTCVFPQLQAGYYAVGLRIRTGNLHSTLARQLANVVQAYAADDLRVTVNQGLLLRYVAEDQLPGLFNQLQRLGLAKPGFDSVADITACPGTETCNLGIASSYGIAHELERLIDAEYAHLVTDTDFKIKISGCMNACGQHTIASLGFHGSSVKVGGQIAPALQVLLGGGQDGQGAAHLADKVLKVPVRRGPAVFQRVIEDYGAHAQEGEYFFAYYQRQGKKYFYDLLKDLSDTSNLTPLDFIDWGYEAAYEQAIGVGECAGVMVDLVQTLFWEADDKLVLSAEAFAQHAWSDSLYHAYAAFLHAAKALCLTRDLKTNTHAAILEQFDASFVQSGEFAFAVGSFTQTVLQLQSQAPSAALAQTYRQQAEAFLAQARLFRNPQTTPSHA